MDLKQRLRADLTTAMKTRDELRTATLRMALSAVAKEEVAGKAARTLTDDEVLRVLTREAKRRREAAEAFDGGGRPELASRERAEGLVLAGYLPASLADDVRYARSRRVSDATQRHRPAYAAVLRGPCVRVVRVGKGSRERPTQRRCVTLKRHLSRWLREPIRPAEDSPIGRCRLTHLFP